MRTLATEEIKVSITANAGADVSGFFEENGYYLARDVYPDEALVPLEEDFDRIVHQLEQSGQSINARWESAHTDALDGGASRVVHTHNVQRYSARWLEALKAPRFLDIAEEILGPDIVLHHSKLFQKPPRHGSPFPVHQDWSYFPTRDDTMIAGIIFLSDADADSGGLCVYPGSHRLGRQNDSSGRVHSELLAEYPLDGAQSVSAKRGDVFFFSYLTLHGSTPNRSDRHRKTVLVQLLAGTDLVLVDGDHNHVNENLVLRGWNHAMNRERAAG